MTTTTKRFWLFDRYCVYNTKSTDQDRRQEHMRIFHMSDDEIEQEYKDIPGG